jgi:hypothetical protein
MRRVSSDTAQGSAKPRQRAPIQERMRYSAPSLDRIDRLQPSAIQLAEGVLTDDTVKVFEFTQTARAPDKPGIYAWYVRPPFISSDVQDQVLDPAVDPVLNQLSTWSEVFNEALPCLLGRFTFDRALRAELSQEGLLATLQQIADCPNCSAAQTCHDHSKQSAQFVALWRDRDMRAGLVAILGRISPLLMAPIYIGIAESLYARIAQHKDDMRNSVDESRFGVRVRLVVDDLNDLIVAVLPLEGSGLSTIGGAIRTHLEGIEWLLNRAFVPSLGKR